MLGVFGIILSLGLLMYLAYRGWSVIILAPILALLAAAFAIFDGGSVHLLATYTEGFMVNLANYVKNYFPVFLLGALFGKVMDDSGAAKAIAVFVSSKIGKGKEIWAVVLSCAIITYGGVSLFVAAFAIYPIGAALFKEADIPKRLLPPAIALGAFTFTMTAIPGTPQIQNAIPMKYFGTDAFAAPILGIVAAIIMLFGGMFWLSTRLAKARNAGEGYGNHGDSHLHGTDTSNLPSFTTAILPILVVLIGNFILSKRVFPNIDAKYLETDYNTTLAAVLGNWSLIVSLILGVLLAIILNYKRFDNVLQCLREGVQGSFLAIMNTASEVGYGNVIKTLAAFGIVAAGMTSISSNPLVGEAISSSVLAGITGSASGGLSIALETFGETFLARASEFGIDPQVLHRVASVACGGLDTLPHNGAVITLLGITGMTHKQCYLNIGMCTVVIPLIACIAIIILGSFGVV
ncbi:GntP family permease [Sinanaerobacter chloroacetimidivorans]|jgi:H+/gluconate symporter-like permease|uniref:GntP family permease n=1 Tax=Sinanaerobacter chloroacetimidivorans TaxID=2818044 RepID=A0A8J8B4J4_9FIRM|nr:GntP family permease [Sinanaerobacter chloroacetimidivorans]MBR0599410.1 GntP family permease [Sinanaerobacter chloroacetimidivorans]